MKAVVYFPLAFIANVHGFILLAPYLVIFLTVIRSLQVYQKTRQALVPAIVPMSRLQATVQ